MDSELYTPSRIITQVTTSQCHSNIRDMHFIGIISTRTPFPQQYCSRSLPSLGFYGVT